MRLEGKVALVTGGGTGIGAATAALFRREGADVVIMGRRSEPLAAVAKETGAVAVPGDAGSAADMAAAVALAKDRFGGLDVVVANAGGSPPSPLLETDDAAWAAAIHGNLTTAFVTCRESLPALLERQGCDRHRVVARRTLRWARRRRLHDGQARPHRPHPFTRS